MSSVRTGTSTRVLRPNPRNPRADGFEAKPPNRPPVVLRPKPRNPLDTCHRRLRPPGRQAIRASRPARTSAVLTRRHGHLHVSSPSSMSQVSATTASHPVIRSLGPSLTSALHRTGPSARHVLLGLHLTAGHCLELHTCTSQVEKRRRTTHLVCH